MPDAQVLAEGGVVGGTAVRLERNLVASGKRGDPRFMSQVKRIHLSRAIVLHFCACQGVMCNV